MSFGYFPLSLYMESVVKIKDMTEETLKDLCLCGETTKVQFKEDPISQKEVAKEMIAFANTKGGVILFGVEDKTGIIKGLSYVQFAGNELGDTHYIDSRDISGTLPWMFKEGMAFLKSYLRHEQNGQNFNSVGKLEIPEVVLEELLQNALVHFDLLNHAAIRILIFNNRIEIINPGCLYGGLSVNDIKLGVSRQRNPLMADLAAKTMIYRGLGSGIVRAMREDSHIDFDNEESANQFKATVWRTIQKKTLMDSSTTQKGNITTQKELNTTQKSVLTDSLTTQKSDITTQKELDTTQKKILEYFKDNPKGTRKEAAMAIGDITEDGVKFTIGKLQQKGLLKRVGGRKHGEWKVLLEE